jgi:hypothetical protein
MALADSNTYIEPTSGTALATARLQQNQDYRSLLTNFSSAAAPSLTSKNITVSGDAIAPPTGTLFHHDNSAAKASQGLVIQHSAISKTGSDHPLSGSGFTRQGIVRSEDSIAQLQANAHTYEPGEVVSVLTGTTSHLQLAVSNASGIARFVDTRIPPLTGNITNTMLSLGTVSGVTSDRMNVASVFNSGGVTGANLTLALQSFHDHGGSGASATRGANVSLGFNSQNSAANASLVYYGAGSGATTGVKSGLRVHGTNGANLAPLAANVIMQSVIGNGVGANDAAPIVPVGTINLWPHATPPTGFLLCDGSAVSRTTYAGLFALIGTTYGAGDTTTTFAVPNFADRVALGKGTNNGLGAPSTAVVGGSAIIATAAATQSITAATTSVAQSAKDSSTVTVVTGVTTSSHTHNVTVPSQAINFIIKT